MQEQNRKSKPDEGTSQKKQDSPIGSCETCRRMTQKVKGPLNTFSPPPSDPRFF